MSPAADRDQEFAVRRIVVTLDSSAHGRAALEAAAELAARLHAELEGLFIEDSDLFNLAALPFGHEVNISTGAARPFDTEELENQLRAETMRMRRALDDAARARRIQSRFRITRGRRVSEAVAAAGEADLLIMGAAGHEIGLRFRPGAEALETSEKAPRSVLLLRSGARLQGKPLVIYDGSEAADKALAAAALLTASRRDGIRVQIAAGDTDQAETVESRARETLSALGLEARFREAPARNVDDMCVAVREAGADILVISAADPRLAGAGRASLLQRIDCPVLLVR